MIVLPVPPLGPGAVALSLLRAFLSAVRLLASLAPCSIDPAPVIHYAPADGAICGAPGSRHRRFLRLSPRRASFGSEHACTRGRSSCREPFRTKKTGSRRRLMHESARHDGQRGMGRLERLDGNSRYGDNRSYRGWRWRQERLSGAALWHGGAVQS